MDPGNGRGPGTSRADDTTTSPDPIVDDDGWPERLAELVARARARREYDRALRADLAARRAAGKRIQHARRLRGRQ